MAVEIRKPSKEEYYLNIAEQVAKRSTCMRTKHGCVIVRDDQIVATGYNGAPRKTMDCMERGNCLRAEMGIPSGQRYEICRSAHGEQNAIINAARAGVSVLNGDIYMYSLKVYGGKEELVDAIPCFICKKIVINAGIKRVITRQADGSIKIYDVAKWAEEWRKRDMLDDQQVYDSKYSNAKKDENNKNEVTKKDTRKELFIGMTGGYSCGKGTVAKMLQEHGFEYSSLSDRLREELTKRKKEITRDNLIALGNRLREEEGFGTLARRTLEKVKGSKRVIIDSIRHPDEVKELRKLKNFILIAVDANQKLRFERTLIRNRENDPKTFSEFKKKDYLEMFGQKGSGQQIGRCIEQADIIIKNETTEDDLKIRSIKMLSDIEKKIV